MDLLIQRARAANRLVIVGTEIVETQRSRVYTRRGQQAEQHNL